MPPKRKATANDAITEPPAKRITRNSRRAASVEPQPAASTNSTRGTRRTKAVEVIQEAQSGQEQPPRATRATARRGRAKPQTVPRTRRTEASAEEKEEPTAQVKRSTAPGTSAKKTVAKKSARKKAVSKKKSPSPEISLPSTSKVTIESLQETAAATQEESDDELLLSPRKKTPPPQPRTPPRSVRPGSVTGTPRMVFDGVEVPTPSKKMKDIVNITRSPRTTSPGKIAASRDGRHLLRDTTPTRAVPKPVPPPSTRRVARPRTPSPEVEESYDAIPDPAPPLSPRHQPVAAPSTKSLQKGKSVATHPTQYQPRSSLDTAAYLEAQKRATLRALHEISAVPQLPDDSSGQSSTNALAFEQLRNLLLGTVERGEGNSCLVVGPKGSGKTQLIERTIASLPQHPVVIRLSGHAQTNDKLAIREIAWQLTEQTGQSLLPSDGDDAAADDDNPFIEKKTEADSAVTLPPPSHLLALIAMLPTLARPTVIILDAFDLFALHARQSLLYCLLDTVQSCRAVAGNKGIAVVGATTRVETVNILEKRVKSRFSGRIIRTAGHPNFDSWLQAARDALCAPSQLHSKDWGIKWKDAIDKFLQQTQVLDLLKETYSLTRDPRILSRLLVPVIATLKPSSPYPSASEFAAAVAKQRAPPRFAFLTSLPYPAICLLIAAMHARTSGHEIFTFEMLHEAFRDQVRVSLSAPVTVDGGGIGMVRCSREVLLGAFEKLVALKVFIPTGPIAVGTGREFVKYRCDIDRAEVKNAVETLGQLNLKKWLNKAN